MTGAGGSIGSKIVEKLVKINFKNIVLLDHSELHLFKLKKKYSSLDFSYEIGDIRDHKKIDFICDTTKNKIGKYTPRSHIPIVNVDYFRKNIPDNTFLFAWNHKKEIFNKEKKILKKTKWFAHIKI